MPKFTITCLILICLMSCAQDLKCTDFHNGQFLVLADSIYSESSRYSRKGTRQVEWSELGDSVYVNVKYVDDCNWILTYDTKSNELDEIEKLINASGGMQLETIEIRGDTLFYNGVLKNDTLNFVQPGSILKLK